MQIAVPSAAVADDVTRQLAEDIGTGDVTGDLIAPQTPARAHILCREKAVLAGLPWAQACFQRLDPNVRLRWHYQDGDTVPANAVIGHIEGNARALVAAERNALNFLQTLSGTATITRRYVDAVLGTGATILDTRKTIPGLRAAQKYAVLCGGGANHRFGLFDMVLIKENHIAAAGSVRAAIAAARQAHPDVFLDCEVESLEELEEAIEAGADRVLLDEFDLDGLREAVARTRGRIPLEVSGGVDLDSVRAIAETGVSFISIGALTKHVQAIDLSMRFDSN